MNKRALSAIPRPTLTDKNREMQQLVQNMSYLVTASRQEIAGSDTLIVNFFQAGKDGLKPQFRTFCQMDDYISQDLTTDRTKWKTGAINSLAGYLYWHKNKVIIVIASTRERKEILAFFQDYRKKHGIADLVRDTAIDSEVEDRIDEYQNSIKERKLRERHQREKAEIDLQMEKFGDVPADYDQFVKDTVFGSKNFIFYSRPKGRAYCTKCGHDFELRKDGLYHKDIAIWNDRDQVMHNKTVLCPCCNTYLVCKGEGMGRQNLFSVKWSVLVQKHGEEVLVRYFLHTKDFQTDFRNPQIETRERFRTVHTARKAIDYEWCRFRSTTELRWSYPRNVSYGYYPPSDMLCPKRVVLYNTNMLETVSGTCMKYSAVDIYLDKEIQEHQVLSDPWCIDTYFNAYRKAPYVEQLLKVGFYRIASAIINEPDLPEFANGQTVLETLKMNKLQFNMLRKVGNPTMQDVDILQYARDIRQEDFDLIRHICMGNYKKYLDMRRYTTLYKLDKYMRKQKISHRSDYFDYIRWLEEMGYDMRNDFNLYPKDFTKAHDDKSKEYVRFKDKQAKEDEKKFKRVMEQLRRESADIDAINMRINGMFIRLPNKLDELKREGEKLHHCVGTYRDKVAKGETLILFIRQEKDPDKPFYTLEWKSRVIQCRGYKNCDMTPEVRAFVDIFQEKMAEYAKRPVKRRKAG